MQTPARAPESVTNREMGIPFHRVGHEFGTWDSKVDTHVKRCAVAHVMLFPFDQNAAAYDPAEEMVELGAFLADQPAQRVRRVEPSIGDLEW